MQLSDSSRMCSCWAVISPANTRPAAYTANAFCVLSQQVWYNLPRNSLSLPVSVGGIWKAVGMPAGIFLWLLGFWSFATSTVAVISGASKMHFSLKWWGFILPNTGLTVAAFYIGDGLGSGGIKIGTSS